METYYVKILKDVYKKSLVSGKSKIYRKDDIVMVLQVDESIYCVLKDHYIPLKEEGVTYEKIKK